MLSGDRAEQVRPLVGEGVIPAEPVAVRPPVGGEGVLGLGDEDPPEAVAVGDLELVEALEVEAQRAARAVDLELRRFALPVAKRVASSVPTAPPANRSVAATASSTARPATNRCSSPVTTSISPTRKRARSTTWLARSPSAPEPGLARVEAPDGLVGVGAPGLQVGEARVEELAEVAGLEDLPGEPDRGDEAVVERAQRRDARRRDVPLDGERLLRVAAQRLLAQNVLARARRFDRRRRMQGVGPEVGEDADVGGDQLAPVGRDALDAEALGEGVSAPASRPATATSRGRSASPSNVATRPIARACARPMNPWPSIPTPMSMGRPYDKEHDEL